MSKPRIFSYEFEGKSVPGWTFKEVGHIEHGDDAILPMEGCKCAQYCEGCGAFVGRWISSVHTKVWCKECWEKKEKDAKLKGV